MEVGSIPEIQGIIFALSDNFLISMAPFDGAGTAGKIKMANLVCAILTKTLGHTSPLATG